MPTPFEELILPQEATEGLTAWCCVCQASLCTRRYNSTLIFSGCIQVIFDRDGNQSGM